MNNLVLACLFTAAFFILLERILPARPLEKVEHWWSRVIIINAFYAAIVLLGGILWDPFFVSMKWFHFFDGVNPVPAALVAYVVLSFVYYWWHRFRHESDFLWRWLHQLHHSPARIETITSLYKHPFEILINTFITSTVCYIILGLTIEQTAWTLYFMATAEYCYHVNIRTPQFLGFFFQRPEMHRVHHQQGLHKYNYSDLPIWDILFGTFSNPKVQEKSCGLGIANEKNILGLLYGKKIHDHTNIKN